MKIGEKTFVALSYELNVNGETVEKVTAEAPLQFVYGAGFLLPKFEAQLKGLGKGDSFAFRLESEDAYGSVIAEAVVELPKDVFMVDGKIEDGLLETGNQVPMSDNQGNRLVGVVKKVEDGTVTMDFNHPMAGQALAFTGSVVEVREATPEDMMPQGGGCSCGEGSCGDGHCAEGCDCGESCDCGEDCDCSDQEKGACGCGC